MDDKQTEQVCLELVNLLDMDESNRALFVQILFDQFEIVKIVTWNTAIDTLREIGADQQAQFLASNRPK